MEKTLKIIVIGDPTVGKTSFINRYVNKAYSENYKATIGVDFFVKPYKWSEDLILKLQFWDIAGQDRFTKMTRVYFQKADACVIMFDLNNHLTFRNVVKWKEGLDEKCLLADGSPITCVLLGNKCDLETQQVQTDEIQKLCKQLNFNLWEKVSVKRNILIDECMSSLVKTVMQRQEEITMNNLKSVPHIITAKKPAETLTLKPVDKSVVQKEKQKCC